MIATALLRGATCQGSGRPILLRSLDCELYKPQRWLFSSRNATRKQHPDLPSVQARLSLIQHSPSGIYGSKMPCQETTVIPKGETWALTFKKKDPTLKGLQQTRLSWLTVNYQKVILFHSWASLVHQVFGESIPLLALRVLPPPPSLIPGQNIYSLP